MIELLTAVAWLASQTPPPIQKDLTFSLKDGGSLTFDLYRRPEISTAVPVVIFVNSGGEGFKERDQSKLWGERVAARGLAFVSYDSVPGRGRDVYEALVASLRRDRARLGIDASRIVLFAVSGNAGLGLPLAMDAERSEIRAAVIYYGGPRASAIRTDLPVLMVRAGLDQPMLNQAIDANVAQALGANAPWTVISHGHGRHGFDLLDKGGTTEQVLAATTEFMARAVAVPVQESIRSGAGEAGAAAALFRRDGAAAVAAYSALAASKPDDSLLQQRLAEACLVAKDYTRALQALERSRALGNGRRGEVGFAGAQAAAGLGDVDRVIEYLKLVPPQWPLDELMKEPVFDRVRGDERLKTFLATRGG